MGFNDILALQGVWLSQPSRRGFADVLHLCGIWLGADIVATTARRLGNPMLSSVGKMMGR